MQLIFEKSVKGRRGTTLPTCDVELFDVATLDPSFLRVKEAQLPEVSELDVMRHFINLSRLNMSVDTHFYPLGSCTMKYNPKINERMCSLSGFAQLHPLLSQLRNGGALTQGSLAVLYETERILSGLFGFPQTTLQPMAGSNGELTAVMMFAAYHRSRGDHKRKVMLIPDAAHGTNPASAAVAGFVCREIPSNENGDVDIEGLKAALGDDVAGLMLTCPNTLGLFDKNVREITRLVHEAGGLCYCDGANFNAIMGRIRPGDLGFDAMHVNIHKSFSTPHGGGGPGSGPVGVAACLLPFLPVSQVVKNDDGTYGLKYDAPESIGYIAPFYGAFGVIVRAYTYLLMLGREGFKRVSDNAVLNANYVRVLLAPYFDQKYDRYCMHECVFSASRQAKNGVHALDLAKSLLDAGYHAPTMYFPLIVPEALMIEPTETESKETLEAFCETLIHFANLAETSPEVLIAAPVKCSIGRVNETKAAKEPYLASLAH